MMSKDKLEGRYWIWKHKREGLEFIRFCHTCSKRAHRLVELGFIDGIKHKLKRHKVMSGYIRRN